MPEHFGVPAPTRAIQVCERVLVSLVSLVSLVPLVSFVSLVSLVPLVSLVRALFWFFSCADLILVPLVSLCELCSCVSWANLFRPVSCVLCANPSKIGISKKHGGFSSPPPPKCRT